MRPNDFQRVVSPNIGLHVSLAYLGAQFILTQPQRHIGLSPELKRFDEQMLAVRPSRQMPSFFFRAIRNFMNLFERESVSVFDMAEALAHTPQIRILAEGSTTRSIRRVTCPFQIILSGYAKDHVVYRG